MKRAAPFLSLLLVSVPVFAIDRTDCRQMTQLGTLYQVRSILARRYSSSDDVRRFVDQRIDELREPTSNGGYRWVRWVRPGGDGPTDKKVHTVTAVQGQGDPDVFEGNSQHVFAVRVVVPSKRSLFKGNNPVYVGDVRISYDESGRRRTDVKHINRWMSLDTSQTFDLEGIYDNVLASAQVSADRRDSKEAVAEIHFKQAVAQDDPDNPSYPTIVALQRVRENIDPAYIDSEIAALESSLFPGSESIPLLTLMRDLRRADELMRSEKAEDKEKGDKLLKETLRRLR